MSDKTVVLNAKKMNFGGNQQGCHGRGDGRDKSAHTGTALRAH